MNKLGSNILGTSATTLKQLLISLKIFDSGHRGSSTGHELVRYES